MSALVEMVKEMLTIEEGLERYVGIDLSNVRTKRKSFNIPCPFHNDKHPSFTVWTKTNRWKCWTGCGSGDVINLIAKALNISNREAIYSLATDLGIANGRNQLTVPLEYFHKASKRKMERTILDEFEKRHNEAFNRLLAIENVMQQQKSKVKSIEQAEEKSLLYHYLPYIAYLLDTLVAGDFKEQVDAVLIVEKLLNGG